MPDFDELQSAAAKQFRAPEVAQQTALDAGGDEGGDDDGKVDEVGVEEACDIELPFLS